MPEICSICNAQCNSAGSDVKCCASCKRYYHVECIKEDVEFKKTRSASKDWLCSECRKPASTSSSVNSSVTATTVTKEFLLKVMEDFKTEMRKSFRDEVAELKTSMDFLSNAIDDTNKTVKSIQSDLSAMKKENTELKWKTATLQREVDGLKERLRSIEQYSRRTNIEISGIPVTPGENVVQVVKDIGAVLGVAAEESRVAAAHRVPSYKKDRIPSLVVQFETKIIRDSWIGKYKEKKNITAKDVNSAYHPNKIWINEHLSPENKFFLSTLKKKCKEVGYKYAWHRDGKFFARKSDGEKCQRMSNLSDIENLK